MQDSTRTIRLPEVVVTANKYKQAPGDRLYPKGELKPEDKSYLKSLKDKDVDAVLSRAIKKPGQVAQYGTSDSDYIKGALNRRKPAIDHRMYKQK